MNDPPSMQHVWRVSVVDSQPQLCCKLFGKVQADDDRYAEELGPMLIDLLSFTTP